MPEVAKEPSTTARRIVPRIVQAPVRWIHRFRTPFSMRMIESHIRPEDRILNVGAGCCDLEDAAALRGWNMTPLDVRNLSCSLTVDPIVYDGNRMPFADDSFDVAVILYVLHHTPSPDDIIREASRVARRLIIGEDIVHGRLHRWFTCAWDSFLNAEYFGHPHSNRTDAAWRESFDRMSLDLVDARYAYSWGMHNGWYVLDRRPATP